MCAIMVSLFDTVFSRSFNQQHWYSLIQDMAKALCNVKYM